MHRTTVAGYTVEYSYRDLPNADLHDLDRAAIVSSIHRGIFNGWLSSAYQSPGSWCVVN